MMTLGSLKLTLQQKPNSRERLIFLAAILVFIVVFFKACVTENKKVIDDLQGKVDTGITERKELDKQAALAKQIALGLASKSVKSDSARIQWIGKKGGANRAADDLVKGAQENNVYLVKYSLADAKDKQNYLFKAVNITVAGALADLGRFIESSERLSIPLVIDRLAFEQSPDSADYITLRLEGGFYAEK